MNSRNLTLLLSQLLAIVITSALSCFAAGENDPSFGAAVYGDLTNGGVVHVVRTQPDGKILIGGKFTEIQGRPVGGLTQVNADGSVDANFNPPSFYGFSGNGGTVYAIVVLPDGKILVAGDIQGTEGVSRPGVRRLNADGTLDSSFFIEQMYFLDGGVVYDMEVQTDGKIVIGGFFFFINSNQHHFARLNADGHIDSSFAPVLNETSIKTVTVQPDGKILAGGYFGLSGNPQSARVFRFNTDGTPDSSFTPVGSGAGSVETIELQSDGKMIVGGSFTDLRGTNQGRISRLNADGTLDSTFNASGSGANAVVNDLVIRSDGKVIIGGNFATFNGVASQRIARLNTNGTLDNSFTNSAAITDTSINDLELMSDSRILAGVTGSALSNSIVRFSADGAFDASFVVLLSTGGVVNKIVVQPDGKILAAGNFRYANGVERRSLARFNADGTLDTSFVPYFNNLAPLPNIYGISVQNDGKIIVGALHGIVLQRLNPDGSRDNSFNTPLTSSSQVYDVVALSDGKILAGGEMDTSRPKLAKFNSDGSFDNTYNPPQPNALIYKMKLTSDGKLMVGGLFTQISNIAARNGLALYTANGSLDNGFVPAAGITNLVDFDFQPDGKVVHVGQVIRRLNANGTLDGSFSATANSGINAIRIQSDGKIIIGGAFSVVNSFPKNGIARLNASGTVDSSFTTIANTSVLEVELQTDGKVLIGGLFTKINGQPNARIERLLNEVTPVRTLFDYDGDSKGDVSVFRPSTNRWYVFKSSDATVAEQTFGLAGDIVSPADFDGDGKTDIAIFRSSSADWWYLASTDGSQRSTHWGESGDVPRPSDFDGDGKADFITFRPSNSSWYRLGSGGTFSVVNFGLAGDKPVTGDFDGDGRSDVAIYRPSTGDWWWKSSVSGAQLATHWGISTDTPAPADYDGDGRTDFAVYRASTGTWYVLNSSSGQATIQNFGIAEDKPVAADYDGDGKADIAVFRPSTGVWYLNRSTAGVLGMQFGVSTDVPTENAYVP